MQRFLTINRRSLLAMTGATVLSACARDRFKTEPVVLGGASVSPDMTIMQAIEASANHQRLAAALTKSGLAEALAGPGPFTLLAPTDAAFAKIRPKSEGARVSGDPDILKRTLRGHIFPAKVSSEDIIAGVDAGTGETRVMGLNGAPVAFAIEEGATRVYDTHGRRALLGPVDAIATNGLIHVIDEVLLLPADEEDEADKVSP